MMNRQTEYQESISAARGILIGLTLGAFSWVVIAVSAAGIITLFQG